MFCRTRHEVDELAQTLNGRGYRAEPLHGGMDQPQRDRVMSRLRDGTAELLIATDVAARGLDVDTLTHVVNYDVPSAPESYVHRIGRVGRAGRSGVAITLAEPRERRLLTNIEKANHQKITIVSVPTIADLRSRQVELTVKTVREAMARDDLEKFEPLLDSLREHAGDEAIARAALTLLHEASGAALDEPEIPEWVERTDRRDRFDGPRPERSGRNDRPAPSGDTGFIHSPSAGRPASDRLTSSVPWPTRAGCRVGRSGRSASRTIRRWSACRTVSSTR